MPRSRTSGRWSRPTPTGTRCRWVAYHPALIKAFADRIEIWCGQEKVRQHPREFAKGQYVLTRALPAAAGAQARSLDNARAFKGQPWGQDFERFRKELEYRREEAGTRQYIDTLLLMTKYPVRRSSGR